MPYHLSLYYMRAFGVKPIGIRNEEVHTLAEAKAVFEDMAGHLPRWLLQLDDPAEYIGVEYEVQMGNEEGAYTPWGVSIEGAETFPNNQTIEASEKWKREHGKDHVND